MHLLRNVKMYLYHDFFINKIFVKSLQLWKKKVYLAQVLVPLSSPKVTWSFSKPGRWSCSGTWFSRAKYLDQVLAQSVSHSFYWRLRLSYVYQLSTVHSSPELPPQHPSRVVDSSQTGSHPFYLFPVNKDLSNLGFSLWQTWNWKRAKHKRKCLSVTKST